MIKYVTYRNKYKNSNQKKKFNDLQLKIRLEYM